MILQNIWKRAVSNVLLNIPQPDVFLIMLLPAIFYKIARLPLSIVSDNSLTSLKALIVLTQFVLH